MASVVAGGVFNAIAFAGAGFLFSRLNHAEHEGEMKRHDKALESLAKAKEKWYENEIAKKDEIQRHRQRLSDANDDINDTNRALDALKKVMTIQYEVKTFSREPWLADYYQPSAEMKEYQVITIGLMGLGGGWLLHKMI